MGDTLTAESAVRFPDRLMSCDIHGRSGTGSFHIPDPESLDLITDLNTAHALDALRGIADQREILIPRLIFRFLLKRDFQNIQIICHLLQTTVSVSRTDHAAVIMLGQQQLDRISSVIPDLRAVRMDDHAFLHEVVAGGDQFFLSFQLHNTDSAGRDLVDPL